MKATLALLLALATGLVRADSTAPIIPTDTVFAESGGLVAFEAEHFIKQELTTVRAWHVTTPHAGLRIAPDTDGTHIIGASGHAYLEVLPDSRWSHDEKLIEAENFSPAPGKMAVLTYRVHFTTPGRYHVWARIFSTGPEDNGVHFGLNGQWPESGQRWQTIKKNAWSWDSRQRTEQVHVGVPGQLWLDIPSAGEHRLHVAMREDGFELDKIVLTTDPKYEPEGTGPESRTHQGKLPYPFPLGENYQDAPAITPLPPKAPTPVTAAQSTPAAPAAPATPAAPTAPVAPAAKTSTILPTDLKLEGTGFYLDQGKWAAIDPAKNKEASVKFIVPVGNARYNITLHAVGENDGSSTYEVYLAGNLVGRFDCPLSNKPHEEGERYTQNWHGIDISEGTILEVRTRIGSKDGTTWSRGRWSKIQFRPQEGGGGHGQSQLELAQAQRAALFKPVPRQPNGDASVKVGGELLAWHKVSLDLAGPFAAETDTTPNPFTDYRYDVTFTHESGSPSYTVPGYFAADGHAAETSATTGTVWRAHLSPDRGGKWNYKVAFTRGTNAATYGGGTPVAPFDGVTGSFTVKGSNKQAPDFRAGGRLTYRGGHYLIAAGSGQPFFKAGADAPETLLAYTDFDDTLALKKEVPLKTWAPHVADWREGDPTWQSGKGKGLIGAINYLSGKGANAVSFLTYNAAGDGDNVWPFVARDEKFHYDCSRLDQWGIVFEHAQARGIFLHFKLQENESDDHRAGARRTPKVIPEALDAGATGPERRLYFREMIARFGHNLALNWNLGEENTQTPDEQRAMAQYIRDTDPYDHLLVIHSFPEQQNEVYENLLGKQSELTGASTQNSWKVSHQRTLHWVQASAAAGRPWVVCNDEQGPANVGVPPDLGYKGYSGKDSQGKDVGYDEHDIRKATLWGTLMAGGAGVEYYFGYQVPENDLLLQDFRSRERSWEFCRIALGFFRDHAIPLAQMTNADELVGNAAHDNSRYCLAQSGKLYLVYLPAGGEATLDLSAAPGSFAVSWFNPRAGGPLASSPRVSGGSAVKLTAPDDQDWLAVVRAVPAFAAGSGTKVLVVGGGGYHDFAQWFNRADVATINAAGHRALYVDDPEVAAVALADADVLVLTSALGWPATPSFRSAVVSFLESGRGFVALHSGVWRTWPDWPEYESRFIGIAANAHPKPFEFEVTVRQPTHPVMQGVPATFKVTDELYEVTTRPGGVPVTVLAETQVSPGSKQSHASIWIPERAKGRTVGIALGHDGRVRGAPEFNRVLLNAIAWTNQP